MSYGWFNWSKKADPAVDKWHQKQMDKAKAEKQNRLENLKRKYHDMPLKYAVMQLFWRERNLTIPDIAKILETDEDTVQFEIDIARQNAR